MVGIQGIGGVPEPKPDRPAENRGRGDDVAPAAKSSQDDVVISNEAQAAASLAKIIQATGDQPDIRPERVAAAKEAIERGDHHKIEVLQTVAERINKLL